jgi:hypothetical protein
LTSTDALIGSLGELPLHAQVLADTALRLAEEIDTAAVGDKPRSAAGAARELRAVLDELTERCRAANDADDWTAAPA